MDRNCYEEAKLFIKKYPMCVTWWRLKKHCAIIDKHLNPGETVQLVVCGQLDNNHMSFFNTGVLAVTNQRICVAQDRLIVGYKFSSITPDMYNDLQVDAGLIWGMLTIDTIKEKVFVSNLDKSCLPEVETVITSFMIEEKRKYDKDDNK